MSDTEEPEVRVYESVREYKRKDGTVGYSKTRSTYTPTGGTPGRQRTPQSILVAESRKLTNKEAEKVYKYLRKIRDKIPE